MNDTKRLAWTWFLFLATSAVGQTPSFRGLRDMVPPDDVADRALALGDVDGDGDVDALIGSARGAERLYRNDGSGTFHLDDASLPTTLSNTTDVLLFDMDGDGDLDAWIATPFEDRLLRNDGTGNFQDVSHFLPAGSERTSALAAGDIDLDGDLDVVVAGDADYARLYTNDGTGRFTNETVRLRVLVYRMSEIALGDVNGDGWLDVFLGGGHSTRDRLLLGDGTGWFRESSAILPFTENASDLALGDLDGDGDLDVVAAYQSAPTRLLWNDGHGAFTATVLSSDRSRYPSHDLGDVDGDGDLDILCTGSTHRLFRNDGGVSFTELVGRLPGGRHDVAEVRFSDLDGDLDLDAFLACGIDERGGRSNLLWLGDGAGSFHDGNATVPSNADTLAVAPFDADGDGDQDVIVSIALEGVFLYRNDGSGRLHEDRSASPRAVGSSALSIGDVDGDGDQDVVVRGSYLLQNDGSGHFVDASKNIPATPNDVTATLLADVDGDQDLDLLLGVLNAPPRLYLNDGTGAFTDASAQVNAPAGATTSMTVGDVDGDLDLDWVIGNGPLTVTGNGEYSHLLLNDGTGRFVDATNRLPLLAESTGDLVLFDADGDTDLDLFKANRSNAGLFQQTSPQDRLFRNDGTGHFTDDSTSLPFDMDPGHRVVAGDVDGDGDLDLVIALKARAFNLFPLRCYLNDGTGTFQRDDSVLGSLEEPTEDLALADFDGDDDLDLYVANAEGVDRLLFGVRRQIAWRGLPRVGKPLTMELYGPAGGIAVRALSIGTAGLPLPPLGSFRLDPSVLLVLSPVGLDVTGLARTTTSVPNDAALLGATIYTQALVGHPLRFTNVEIQTFTGF